jgi:hypothetical protein
MDAVRMCLVCRSWALLLDSQLMARVRGPAWSEIAALFTETCALEAKEGYDSSIPIPPMF